MTEQPVSLSKISWRDLFPWTIILRTLPIAVGVSVLVWALIGVVLTPTGWFIGEQLFITNAVRADDPFLKELTEINRSPYQAVFPRTGSVTAPFEDLGAQLSGPALVFENLVRPFRALFRASGSARGYLYLLFGSLWSLLVWSFAGCAISRVCILRLTRDEPVGLGDAFEFALEKYKVCVGAVVMPLAAVAVICVPLAIFGLFLGFDIGVLLGGLFWFLVLGASAISAFLLLGLMFGWPLMIASVSTEGQNSFDAVTRAFAYTFQRPFHYLGYVIVALFFGGFCWLIVSNVTKGVVELSYWSTSWGANRFGVEGYDEPVRRIAVIKGDENPIIQSDTVTSAGEPILQLDQESAKVSSSLSAGRKLIGFWNGVAHTLAAAFIYGLFWCMAAAIYLLLRRDVDETELDEVYVFDEKRTYDLPPLKSDRNGIPQVQEPVPVDENESDPDTTSSSSEE